MSVENFTLSHTTAARFCFTAQDRGVVNLYSVAYPSGTPRVVTRGGAIAASTPARLRDRRQEHDDRADDLFRVSLSGGAVTPITRENDGWLKDVAFSAPESLTVAGAAGTQVQYWLIKPPNFDASRKYPMVFLIHGGPQGAWEDAWSTRWNPALWAAQGWVVAAPNPRGSTGFGQKFVDDISQDWGGKVMVDLNAVVRRRREAALSSTRRAWGLRARATAATR